MAPWSRAASGRGLASRRWGAGLAALVVTQTLAAQEPPPTFRAESQVVVLDMVARDGRDRPITDLRQDEVQVFEDGQACTIVSFRLVRGLAIEPASVASGRPPEAGPGPEAAPPEPTRANLVVLLFDRLAVQNAALARKGALELLSQRFPPNTWFAVYKLNRSMQLLQAFTSEPKELAGGIERATTGDETARVGGVTAQAPAAPPPPGGIPAGPDLPGSLSTVMTQIAAGADREVGDLANRVDAMDSLYALRALTRGLGQVRGRKTILYFAEDRELPESVTQVYDSTLAAANRANVTVHTVNTGGVPRVRLGDRSQAAGILAGMSASSGVSPVPIPGIGSTALSPAEQSDGPGGPMMDRLATLQNTVQGSFLEHVAIETGGRWIATNDIAAGLVPVVEEVGQYYEIVYEPARPEPDGRFRKIGVKTTRKGARLRTRSGYFATSDSAPTLAAFELPLLGAIGAAESPRDFAHASTVMHFAGAGKEREAVFLAEVPLSSAKIVEDPDRGTYRARLALLGFVRDEAGRSVARFSQDWPIEGPLSESTRLHGTTAVFKRSLSLPPGAYSLVTAIQDVEANRTSVERSHFDVPPVVDGLALGSLAVIRKASGEPASGPDPLYVSGVTIAPHVGSGEVPAGTKEVSLFLPIYPSLAGSPVGLELEVRRAGDTVTRITPRLPGAGSDGRIAWIGSLSTKGMAPGLYEVLATVRQGDAVAEERAEFSLLDRGAVEARPLPELTTPPPVPPDLVPVLEAAAKYVLEYEQSFQNISADETYSQRALPRHGEGMVTPTCLAGGCLQVTKADVVFARLSGAVPWGCFRDVYEVDGRKVRDTQARLEALFAQFPVMGAAQRAEALLAESARYNVGPALRNINFPTLALAFLHPMNQGRFAWSRGGKRRFGTTEGIEVQFEEVARPTIVDRGGQSDLPSRGRFWIDPARGTVLRSETSFRFESHRGVRVARAYVATEYRPEPKLAMWVPSEMREEYEDVPGASIRTFGSRTEATARYGGFRRFTVSTEEEGRVAEEPPSVPR